MYDNIELAIGLALPISLFTIILTYWFRSLYALFFGIDYAGFITYKIVNTETGETYQKVVLFRRPIKSIDPTKVMEELSDYLEYRADTFVKEYPNPECMEIYVTNITILNKF